MYTVMKPITMQQVFITAGVVFGLGLLVSLALIFTANSITSTIGWILLFSFIAFAVVFGATYSKDLKIKRRGD